MAKIILRISWYHRNLGIPSWETFLKIDPQHLTHVEVFELNGFDRFELFTKRSLVALRKIYFWGLYVFEKSNQESFSAK